MQRQWLDGALEAALDRVSTPDELVLVRRLQADLALLPTRTDGENARAWGRVRTLVALGVDHRWRGARPALAGLAALAALAVLVGVARVYVGAHLPLDVVGGAALGVLAGGSAHLVAAAVGA